MKKVITIVFVLIFLTLVSVYLYKRNNTAEVILSIQPKDETVNLTPTISATPSPVFSLGQESNKFNVEYIIVRDPKKIVLYDNSSEKLSSTDAEKKYACDKIVSGGFWREDNGLPTGLFITDSKTINKAVNSDFSNGIFFMTDELKTSIININSFDNSDAITTALQSGPLLVADEKIIKLSINNDENARRIVIAKTTKDETVFLAFYNKSMPLSGPKLQDLPKLLADLSKDTSLKISSALNLDGGSHSTFISGDINLGEVARVGSFFCIKP